jgi:L-asparaginase
MKPVLLIHGGAGARKLTREKRADVLRSLEFILRDAYSALARGESALSAVKRAVVLLEDDPLYNAGKGSKIQSDGKIRLSASIMDGKRRRFAGCVNVEGVKNPIRLAHALLGKSDRVLSGEGAKRMARELGLPFASALTPHQLAQFRAKKSGKSGTVGAVAIDRDGRLAAATSTGGRGLEYPFRVSDSPTAAGNFANGACAVSATGVGEQIVEFAAASAICTLVEAGFTLEKALSKVFQGARKADAQFGVIGVDRRGGMIHSTLTPSLIWASATHNGLNFFR